VELTVDIPDEEILERAADILDGPAWRVPYAQTAQRVRQAARKLRARSQSEPAA
jgi:hypothetical protein